MRYVHKVQCFESKFNIECAIYFYTLLRGVKGQRKVKK